MLFVLRTVFAWYFLYFRLFQEDCDRDFFMTPEEAMDYGLIDEVVKTKTSHIAKPAMPSLEEVF